MKVQFKSATKLRRLTAKFQSTGIRTEIPVKQEISFNGKTFKALDEITLAVNEAIPAFKAGTVELPVGEKISTSGGDEISAGSDITVSAEDGAAKIIGALDEGDTFTLNGDEYEMTELGLLKNGELIYGTDAETSEFDLSGEINLLKLIAVDGEITLELAEENSGGRLKLILPMKPLRRPACFSAVTFTNTLAPVSFGTAKIFSTSTLRKITATLTRTKLLRL